MKSPKGKINQTSWIIPREMSEEEFLEGIKKAEKGPFHTVQESMARFEEWLKTRPKK